LVFVRASSVLFTLQIKPNIIGLKAANREGYTDKYMHLSAEESHIGERLKTKYHIYQLDLWRSSA
jgi:hypothetical protein